MFRYAMFVLTAGLLLVVLGVMAKINAPQSTATPARPPLPTLQIGESYAITMAGGGAKKQTYIGTLVADRQENWILSSPELQVEVTENFLGLLKNTSVARQRMNSNVAVKKADVDSVAPTTP